VPESVLSIIDGNVAQVTFASRSPRVNPSLFASLRRALSFRSVAIADGVEGIHVTVDGSDAAADTDQDGLFSVSGPFSGPTVLRFQRDTDHLDSAMTVNVPKGGSLSLRDLTLASDQASSQSQDLSFDGIVESTDCARDLIDVVSRFDSNGQRYVVDLSQSSLTDGDGRPMSCVELRKGDAAHVQGDVRPNGTIAAGSVSAEPQSNAGSSAAAKAGTVTAPPPPPSAPISPPSVAAPTPPDAPELPTVSTTPPEAPPTPAIAPEPTPAIALPSVAGS